MPDIKNGMTVPPEWSLSKLLDFASKPAWVAGVLRGKRRTFGNLVGHLKGTDDITALSTWINSQFDTTLNWKDVDWIRRIWPGKLILKGILDVEDAEEAVKTGAQALVVSNHGGRQLDGAPSSIEVAAGDRRRRRLEDRDHVRRRHSHRPGRDARARARRQVLHDRPRLSFTGSAPRARPASRRRSMCWARS